MTTCKFVGDVSLNNVSFIYCVTFWLLQISITRQICSFLWTRKKGIQLQGGFAPWPRTLRPPPGTLKKPWKVCSCCIKCRWWGTTWLPRQPMQRSQQLILAPKLSNGTIFKSSQVSLNDLEWPLTQISKSRYYLASNSWKTVQIYLQWRTNKKSYMIYRTASFWMILNNP